MTGENPRRAYIYLYSVSAYIAFFAVVGVPIPVQCYLAVSV